MFVIYRVEKRFSNSFVPHSVREYVSELSINNDKFNIEMNDMKTKQYKNFDKAKKDADKISSLDEIYNYFVESI